MIKNNFLNYILIILSITFLYAKDQSIIFQVYNFDHPDSKIKKINYELQDSDGNLIKKGKLKKGFLKRKFKIKYDFNSNKDPVRSIINGRYNLIINYKYNKEPYQNILEIKKAWYADPDFFEYGKIDKEEQERETNNAARGIIQAKTTYPYEYKIPLKMKSSLVTGKILDDEGNRINDVEIELSKSLQNHISNSQFVTTTNKKGEFEIEVDLLKEHPEFLKTALIISKKGYHPQYYPISYKSLKNRDPIEIKRISLNKKKEKAAEIYCELPRLWRDSCSECVCKNDNEIWYYELEACDVRDCKNSNQQIIIKNNKIVCEDRPSNDYLDDEELDFDDRSACFLDLQKLKRNYNKCKKNKKGLKQVKEILSNYNCNFDLYDYMNNIYLINALYSEIMSLSDDDFISLFTENSKDPNQFEYLDILFTHINDIIVKENSMNNIKIDSNVQPYLANMYLKQVQFYYKYCELLYSLKSDLAYNTRKPRVYIFDIDSEDFDDRFEQDSENLIEAQNDVYDKLKTSLKSYKEASASAKNWGAYASTVIGQLEKDMEWIPFVW